MTTQAQPLQSASKRTFVVALESKPGLSHPTAQVLVVEAYGEEGAKEEAAKRMRKNGKYKNRTHNMWIFKSIEEAIP